MMFAETYKDCYARLEEGRLIVGNDRLERGWSMDQPIPEPLFLLDKTTGKLWLSDAEGSQWEAKPGRHQAFFRAGITEGEMRIKGMTANVDDDFGIGENCLSVDVALEFGQFSLHWIHKIYPGLSVLRSFLRAVAAEGISMEAVEEAMDREYPEEWPEDFQDSLPVAPEHCRWESVCFNDQTDDNSNLVFSVDGLFSRREFRKLQGNLLLLRDCFDGSCMAVVKEGPTPLAYLDGTDYDFRLKGKRVFISGWGFDARTCGKSGELTSYGSAILLSAPGESIYRTLHHYQRAIRRFDGERDAVVMSNTWGDNNANGKICESFILAELERASRLGISVFQIDDGWEKGMTCNSVGAKEPGANAAWSEGYYKTDPEFWTINRKNFPNGLEPVAEYAKAHGIRLGLWFSPDSLNGFENWRRDSDVLIGLHRRYDIRAFKMDGLVFSGKRSEENFARLVQRVIRETKGRVTFNLDTTAGVRNGFFDRVQYGSLFLENRYTDRFGDFPNYWPHLTLRSLWLLSRYMPTERLQIEFLNVERNAENYGVDPLAPICCGIEYAFAISMFASPLAWMELTGLSEDAMSRLETLIPVYRGVQAEILKGFVQPIGREPDGTGWTGFLSDSGDGSGYLLILRELNRMVSHEYQLPGLENVELSLTPLLGYGKQDGVNTGCDGEAVFILDRPLSFALYRYNTAR